MSMQEARAELDLLTQTVRELGKKLSGDRSPLINFVRREIDLHRSGLTPRLTETAELASTIGMAANTTGRWVNGGLDEEERLYRKGIIHAQTHAHRYFQSGTERQRNATAKGGLGKASAEVRHEVAMKGSKARRQKEGPSARDRMLPFLLREFSNTDVSLITENTPAYVNDTRRHFRRLGVLPSGESTGMIKPKIETPETPEQKAELLLLRDFYERGLYGTNLRIWDSLRSTRAQNPALNQSEAELLIVEASLFVSVPRSEGANYIEAYEVATQRDVRGEFIHTVEQKVNAESGSDGRGIQIALLARQEARVDLVRTLDQKVNNNTNNARVDFINTLDQKVAKEALEVRTGLIHTIDRKVEAETQDARKDFVYTLDQKVEIGTHSARESFVRILDQKVKVEAALPEDNQALIALLAEQIGQHRAESTTVLESPAALAQLIGRTEGSVNLIIREGLSPEDYNYWEKGGPSESSKLLYPLFLRELSEGDIAQVTSSSVDEARAARRELREMGMLTDPENSTGVSSKIRVEKGREKSASLLIVDYLNKMGFFKTDLRIWDLLGRLGEWDLALKRPHLDRLRLEAFFWAKAAELRNNREIMEQYKKVGNTVSLSWMKVQVADDEEYFNRARPFLLR